MKKKVLIIGNSPSGYSIAKKLSEKYEVYITPSSDMLKEFVTCLDIREDNSRELLEFVVENSIDMTIAISQKAINSDIASLFADNNQAIFAPTSKANDIVSNKVFAKKTMYKLRIPTPKFGIFEKQNFANDYLKNQKIPYVIKTNESNSAVIITSQSISKNILDMMFAQKNNKVIIEDYIYGTPFSFYTITDGFKALPIGSSLTYKHALEGDGGQLTSGAGSCVPNYKISFEHEYMIMDNVIYPTLDYLQMQGNPYLGILGVNGIITDDGNIQILGWQSFMQDCDADGILNNIQDDLYDLFEACIIGSFSDEVDSVNINDKNSVSVVLVNKNKDNTENSITGLDNLDDNISISFYPSVHKNKYLEYEAGSGSVLVFTSFASSLAKASDRVYSELLDVDFKGISYRKDICKYNI